LEYAPTTRSFGTQTTPPRNTNSLDTLSTSRSSDRHLIKSHHVLRSDKSDMRSQNTSSSSLHEDLAVKPRSSQKNRLDIVYSRQRRHSAGEYDEGLSPSMARKKRHDGHGRRKKKKSSLPSSSHRTSDYESGSVRRREHKRKGSGRAKTGYENFLMKENNYSGNLEKQPGTDFRNRLWRKNEFAGQYLDETKYEEFPFEASMTTRSRDSNNEGVIDKYSHSSQEVGFGSNGAFYEKKRRKDKAARQRHRTHESSSSILEVPTQRALDVDIEKMVISTIQNKLGVDTGGIGEDGNADASEEEVRVRVEQQIAKLLADFIKENSGGGHAQDQIL